MDEGRGDVLGPLHTLLGVGSFAGWTDWQLLERFAQDRDEVGERAFAVLIERYGAAVLRVCRGVLGDPHEADDAFQATFLVLARRARSIRDRDAVGRWLMGVAYRVAGCARAAALRRRAHERKAAEGAAVSVEPEEPGDWVPLLREEVGRLPMKFRTPLMLCYLEGLTQEEVARRLGWPIGTVRSRVARGRERLRSRLVFRGVAPSAAAMAVGSVWEAGAVTMPVALMQLTVRAAMGRTALVGAVSTTVATLTGEVIRTMFWTKLKMNAAVMMVGLLVAGAGIVAGQSGARPGQGPPGKTKGTQAELARAEEDVRTAEAALETARARLKALRAGVEPPAAKERAPVASDREGRPRAVDREAWARKLAALNDANWRTAFAVGEELTALPDDEAFAILKANWAKITSVEARQQLLKAWRFALPTPVRPGDHPRLLDGLDLGMRDPSPKVQEWAINYLGGIALHEFAEDFPAYKAWYQANRDKPVADVIADAARRVTIEAAHSVKTDAVKRAERLAQQARVFNNEPAARRAAMDAGLLRTLARWASTADAGSPKEDIELATHALSVLGEIKPGEAELRRVVVPLIARDKPHAVRRAAMSALGGKENVWAIDLLLDALKEGMEEGGTNKRATVWAVAGTLASFDVPRVIPTLIAVIDADNTYDTVYGVGYFGLGRLTGVQYHESHNGAWWRQWWEKNKERYPEAVRTIPIPVFPKKEPVAEPAPARAQAADDPLADVADFPAKDLRIGGDEKKRYFLIGAREARPPAAGYGLLVVLPGGDGSADFQPFLRRMHKNALNDRWLVAQAVAPRWDEKQFNQVVWPTEALRYPAARFTTEAFIRDIIADVRKREKIDPRRVILLGWSSGGPPCYAMAMQKETPVTGAFIAMSVFRPKQLPGLEAAKGKAFYLLQSPQDRVTTIPHAEAAEKALQAAGARVRLRRYEGGHGWHGPVWTMIGEGIEWLDRPVGTE
jgi:RNA polymerase sigma factor (sigma-70 family)